jgi:hypothetical protein
MRQGRAEEELSNDDVMLHVTDDYASSFPWCMEHRVLRRSILKGPDGDVLRLRLLSIPKDLLPSSSEMVGRCLLSLTGPLVEISAI